MTALFVVMFIDQWEDAQDHKPALVGIVCSVPGDLWKREVYPSVNGIDRFMLPGNEEA